MQTHAEQKEQENFIKELSQKTDQATRQVQLIACRVLDVPGQRFVAISNGDERAVASSQKREGS